MVESLELFDSIINNEWLLNKPVLLFLNNDDLFEEKIPYSPITIIFPDYTGKQTAIYYWKRLFLLLETFWQFGKMQRRI